LLTFIITIIISSSSRKGLLIPQILPPSESFTHEEVHLALYPATATASSSSSGAPPFSLRASEQDTTKHANAHSRSEMNTKFVCKFVENYDFSTFHSIPAVLKSVNISHIQVLVIHLFFNPHASSNENWDSTPT
jgi:hypothetical protein